MSNDDQPGPGVIDTPGETVPLPSVAMPLAIIPDTASHDDDKSDDTVDFAFLTGLGFVTPIANHRKIRAAFAYLQRVYAAVLDERDFIYVMTIEEHGKKKEKTFQTLKEAQDWSAKYKVPFRASPKKSGITKLAMAFGIEATRTKVRGLPDQPDQRFSYVVYECVHTQTGRKADGIGWSDLDEKNGWMSRHDCIATADTRAFNRGVLRLLAFGEVSAEEILSNDQVDAPDVAIPDQPLTDAHGEPANLPAISSPGVMEAAQAWAEAAGARSMNERFLPKPRQTDHEARDLRGRARIGDAEAAQALGAAGYEWAGPAQLGQRQFIVTASPVDPRSTRKPVPATVPIEESGHGAAPGADEAPHDNGGDIPPQTQRGAMPDLTQAQLVDLSKKLMEKMGDKTKAKAWLQATVGVDSTAKLTPALFEKAMLALKEVS